ncbi:MAG TPA: bifunctional indole-3-glycerol-phosphate synthase TrpC/phosphoribosylanthranilate isomerase TrpF [Sphingomicrobium sp.]|nr:bifunctional indole-3-glycerol-phosphate synthase TrpC/phosphoribosylanthranilate isomerase TrpF [Sphingomicrobium sp.]
MADVLARIVERKRREVAERLGGKPVAAGQTKLSLRAALARGGARFIMEVKLASPSGHRSRATLEEAIAAYAPVADAISVLTDGPDFGGSLNDLRRVRTRFGGPILAKDFIVNPAQVSEARAAGADAVLVMMSVLGDAEAAAVLAEAERFAMDAIVEVHDEKELHRALAIGAKIIGINNRDLKTLTTDLAVTERLAPLVPPDVLVISESGIGSRADVERLAPCADAFLVGSSLMASHDIREAARALVHGRVKLCGLTRGEDVALAARSGATHSGFIFVPGTPRAIDEEQGAELADLARRCGLKSVGVFRNSGPAEVAKTAHRLGLDAVQLHGDEDVSAVRAMVPSGTELWAMCGVGDDASSCRPSADRSLFDTVRGGQGGGTGSPFDWSLLQGRGDLPSGFLAGGIGPHNAWKATRVGAYGIDVGSSVEARPGAKDAAKVEALFAALRPQVRGGA